MTCNKCEKKHSEEWNISTILAKSNRKLFRVIIVLICFWFLTVIGMCGGFVWYLNQHDFVPTDGNISISGDNGGNVTYDLPSS